MTKRLAVIADSPRFLRLLERHLIEGGYDPFLFTSPETAYGRLADLQPAAVFLAIRQKNPAADWELVDAWSLDPLLSGITLIVSPADPRHAGERMRHLQSQGCAVLLRPFAPGDLVGLVGQLVGAAPRGRRD